MRTRLTHMVMAAALLLPGLASAQQDQTDDSAIRYQIAKHLTRASFDAFFPFRDGWRDARKIAQKIEIKVEGRASRQNGAARQTVKWRIKESEGKQVPKLGGVAQIWTYATSARPSYYPRTDVGDVQVMRVAPKGWRLSSAAVSLKPGASESRADLAKRGVQAYLGRQGFGKLLQGRDLSSAGIRVRTSGDSILWKAGRKVGGDGRVSYALGGRMTLKVSQQSKQASASVQVNVASAKGWRVAGPGNGSGRRHYWPTGQRMRSHPAFGRKGR